MDNPMNPPDTTATPEEALALREQAVALRERRQRAEELIRQHHLPPQVSQSLAYDSDEALNQSIALAKTMLTLADSTPNAPRAPAPAADRRAMTYTERAAAYLANQPIG